MTIIGGFSAKIEELKSKLDGDTMILIEKLSVPQIKVSGWFNLNAVFNDFPLKYRGKFDAVIDDIALKFVIKGSLAGENLKVTSLEMFPTIKNMNFNIEFSHDKSISMIIKQDVCSKYSHLLLQTKLQINSSIMHGNKCIMSSLQRQSQNGAQSRWTFSIKLLVS